MTPSCCYCCSPIVSNLTRYLRLDYHEVCFSEYIKGVKRNAEKIATEGKFDAKT